MSDDSFNPYHEWLGLDRGVTQPNFYQLLRLDPAEQSLQRIAEAGNQAMARLRSCRPGSRGAEWAKVLEEVTAAASCLSDSIRRAEYDRQLGRGGVAKSYSRPAPRSRMVPTVGGASIPTAVPLQGAASVALPMQAPQGVPAALAQSPAGTAAYVDPMAPVVPGNRAAAGPVPGHASSYGGAMTTPTASRPSHPAAHGHPATGTPTQTVLGKDRAVSAKVRQHSSTSNLTVIAVSAGAGMMILAGAIVLIVLSQKPEDRVRHTHGSFAHNRPIVSVPSPSAESFHRPAPPPRRVRPVERGEVLTQPTFGAPSGNPPLGSQSGVMPEVISPSGNTLRMPAFPAAPTLPFADAAPPAQPQPTAPSDSPTMPPQPAEAMPDGATDKPTEPELEPGMPDSNPEQPKPTEASTVTTSVKPEEVAALAKALKAARDAIQNRRYDEAEAELNKAAALPKLPADHAKCERLRLLVGYAKNFQSALDQAVAGLHPGD
jgi:hypothetical protein